MKKIYCTERLKNIYDNKSWEDILDDFQIKINQNLLRVPEHERNDLEQEIKLKIIEKINFLLENDRTPGFWQFLSGLKKQV